MNAVTVPQATGDWSDKRRDLDTQFARFGSRALRDHEICALSLATMVTPDANPGAGAYLTYVSQTTGYVDELTTWGLMLAHGISQGKYRSKAGRYRRSYVEGYREEWGYYAIRDALTIVMLGHDHCPGINERSGILGCGNQAYQRIRDFVAGAYAVAINDYRLALSWAMGHRRDSLLESRWGRVTGEKWDAAKASRNMEMEGASKIPSQSGSSQNILNRDTETRFAVPGWAHDPATKYPGVWDMESPHRT